MTKAKHYAPFAHLSQKELDKLKLREKERKCLNCNRPFVSHGPNNRLCATCRYYSE